ncbi:hypothetical protein ACE18D_25890, partial [Escherichia coli]
INNHLVISLAFNLINSLREGVDGEEGEKYFSTHLSTSSTEHPAYLATISVICGLIFSISSLYLMICSLSFKNNIYINLVTLFKIRNTTFKLHNGQNKRQHLKPPL